MKITFKSYIPKKKGTILKNQASANKTFQLFIRENNYHMTFLCRKNKKHGNLVKIDH